MCLRTLVRLLGLTGCLCLCAASALAAGWTKIEDKAQFVVEYLEPKKDNRAAADLVRESKIFDELVKVFNEQFALPREIKLSFAEDEEGPYYLNGRIVMNYDFVTAHLEMFSQVDEPEEGKAPEPKPSEAEVRENVLQVVEFVFYHELGHALIDVFELPVLGKEEDAVDSLAALIAVEMRGDGDIALAGAEAFGLWAADREEFDDADFWDEHSLNEQRFYSTVCLVYGSDPETYKDLLTEAGMPKEREQFCQEDYEQKSTSWENVLGPYMKDEPAESDSAGDKGKPGE